MPIFSTYFSGTDNEDADTVNGYEWVYGIAVDPGDPDAFWIAGQTESTTYHENVGSAVIDLAYQEELAGDFDVFVAKLRHTTGPPVIEYFSYVGGAAFESQKNMYLDDSGNLYVGGWTRSDDFPTTTGTYDELFGDPPGGPTADSDVYFLRFDIADEFIRGDANQDGDVNDLDIPVLSAALTGPPLVCADTGDVNDDGVFDLADRTYLNAFVNANGPAPPAPYPACGPDPTPDGLPYCQYSFVCP